MAKKKNVPLLRCKIRIKEITMPTKSKAQARFMGMVASGKKKVKGLSKEKAKEFTRGQKLKKLPEHKTKKK